MENEPSVQTDVERLHEELSRVEQAQLLQWMAQNLGNAEPLDRDRVDTARQPTSTCECVECGCQAPLSYGEVMRTPVPVLVSAAFVCGLGGCGGGEAAPADAQAPGDADGAAAAVDPLAGVGTAELVQDGFRFTEGPQWRDAEADLLFSDIDGNTTYRHVPGGAVTIFRMPSHNANGLALDPAGQLLAAEHGSRTVTRATVAIASVFEAQPLNSPNDVIAAADGTIYFTDPPYGIQDSQQKLDFNGVFRISPAGELTAEQRGPRSARPNGVGLSPDGATLYVADTADGNLYRFPVLAGGALGARTVVAATSGNPDGLAIDAAGNVFVTTQTGVEVFAPTGARWGVIAVPKQPANCAFGDADHKTLYITARTALYRVRLAHAGLPRN